MTFARRLKHVDESATLKLNALVQELKSQGRDVVNLTAGEPDFSVPAAIKAAVKDAVDRDQSKYTPTPGLVHLRRLIAQKTNRDQPALATTSAWGPEHVVVSNGAKHSLFNSALALLDPGAEAIVPAPYWLSVPEMIKLAGAKPVVAATKFEQGFKLQPAELQKRLTSKTRALFLNSPSNPTGAVYTRQEFQALAKVLQKHRFGKNVTVISDEIYDRLTYGANEFCSFLDACPEMRDRTVTINGLSKTAAMTGWRIGWAVAPAPYVSALNKIQGQSTSGISALTQWAGIAALQAPMHEWPEWNDWMRQYRRRREIVLEILAGCGKLKVLPPEGAFYVFFGVKALLGKKEDAFGWCERLLHEAGVALVPGTPFGAKDFVRLSFATDEKSLQDGCTRLVRFCEGRARQ